MKKKKSRSILFKLGIIVAILIVLYILYFTATLFASFYGTSSSIMHIPN